tara:strand:+ start:56 stop:352 length:297 start_codon:yes stop_codon:yes gene_type:complete
MTFESYFFVVWFLVALYVLLGNYVYFRKILPALGDETGNAAPRFLPSGQFSQVKEYLRVLEKEQERPWFYYFLKNIVAINALFLLAVAPLFLKAFGAI